MNGNQITEALTRLLGMLLTGSSALGQMSEDDDEVKALREAIRSTPIVTVACPDAELVIENYQQREPKSGLPVGTWIEGESVWGYKGTLSVVIQFAKPSVEYATEPMVVSKCPPCERRFLMDKYPSRKVKRWFILPP